MSRAFTVSPSFNPSQLMSMFRTPTQKAAVKPTETSESEPEKAE